VLSVADWDGACRRWLQDTSKRTRRFFLFFRAPPLPVSPGSPEADPMIDQKQALRIKKIGLITTFSRVYPKKGEHAPGK